MKIMSQPQYEVWEILFIPWWSHISKEPSNREAGVMSSPVGPFQEAFIHGKHILDSVLIANEWIHYWEGRKSSASVQIGFGKDQL